MSSDSKWSNIRDNIQCACEEILGVQQRKSRKWISPSSWNLISARRTVKLEQLKAPRGDKVAILSGQYKLLTKQIKEQLRKDKNDHHIKMSSEAQLAANMGNMKGLYKIMRELSKPKMQKTKPILYDDGMLKTNKEEQLVVWKKHFEKTLNIIHDENIDDILIRRQHNTNRGISDRPPSLIEVKNAILALKNGKAPGCDGLPAECFKVNPEATATILHNLFEHVWETEDIPTQWKESIIIKLPKKGNLSLCDNWRGISITPTVTKFYNKIILDRIAEPLNKLISPTQAGFMPHRSCIDHINTIRILIEQSVEFNSTLYITFVDFTKAFDALKRDFIWKALEARGIPNHYEATQNTPQQTELFEMDYEFEAACVKAVNEFEAKYNESLLVETDAEGKENETRTNQSLENSEEDYPYIPEAQNVWALDENDPWFIV
ncbi:uncharacterized protein [Musca autumnalis]|uniref:uncharacterized protein n=1 Tax=Musca autumnalis TaxID=221902 RepID=UPI003CE8761A